MMLGQNVRLRAIERQDLPFFQAALGNPAVNRYLYFNAPLSTDDETAWYEAVSKDAGSAIFAIDDCRDGTPTLIGNCGAHTLDHKNGIADIGIFIGRPELWGKGLGTEAFYLLIRYLHEELRMHRVELEVFASHAAGIRSYQKLGFVQEGVRRQALFRRGAHHDMVTMSCLPGELVCPYDESKVSNT